MPLPVNVYEPDWPLALAQNFLDAALSCDFECERVFVSPGINVEAPPPECPCQLAAQVTPGFERTKEDQLSNPCPPRRMAMVTLVLDLCVDDPGKDAVKSTVEANNEGRVHVMALQEVMRGLQSWRAAGHLAGALASIGVDTWAPVSQEGGNARWQTRWVFRE